MSSQSNLRSCSFLVMEIIWGSPFIEALSVVLQGLGHERSRSFSRALFGKVCDYCGSAVEELNAYAWEIDRFYEVR